MDLYTHTTVKWLKDIPYNFFEIDLNLCSYRRNMSWMCDEKCVTH